MLQKVPLEHEDILKNEKLERTQENLRALEQEGLQKADWRNHPEITNKNINRLDQTSDAIGKMPLLRNVVLSARVKKIDNQQIGKDSITEMYLQDEPTQKNMLFSVFIHGIVAQCVEMPGEKIEELKKSRDVKHGTSLTCNGELCFFPKDAMGYIVTQYGEHGIKITTSSMEMIILANENREKYRGKVYEEAHIHNDSLRDITPLKTLFGIPGLRDKVIYPMQDKLARHVQAVKKALLGIFKSI